MTKQIVIFLLILVVVSSCKKDDESLTFTGNWDEDIYYFGEDLEEKHKNLYHNVSKAEFRENISDLRERSDNLSDNEIYIELMKLIGKIGDSHTSIDISSLFHTLPFRVMILSDGVVITNIDHNHVSSLGKTITGINGTDINVVIDSIKTITAYENESCLKWFAGYYIIIPEVLNYFGFSESDSKATLNLDDGSSIDLQANNSEMSSIYDNVEPPLYISNTSDYYWYRKLDDDKTLYIQYNRCRESDNLAMSTFKNQIAQVMNETPEISRIAFDLRINTGGNSQIAYPLLQLLKSYVEEERITNDNLFVIIGRKTFSSAILNSLDLQESVDPLFIGEPTGGKPNHFGEVKSFSLPHSKLKVRYSSKYFRFVSGNPSSINPDVLIELSAGELVEGKDPVLEYITGL